MKVLIKIGGSLLDDATSRNDLARQIAAGLREVEVGPLDTTRDFVDVRDVVRALALIVAKGTPGEIYNVCSGVETSVEEVTRIFARIAGGPWSLVRRPAPDRAARALDVPRQRGSFAKLRAAVGWAPTLDFDGLVRLLVDADLERLRPEVVGVEA